MKNTARIILCTLLVAPVFLCIGFQSASAQDLLSVSPDGVKVLVDNDRVRILEVQHGPGAKEAMHSHPPFITVFLEATRMKVTLPDGKVVEKDRKAGEVQYNDAVTHAAENVGTGQQHVIVIELKK